MKTKDLRAAYERAEKAGAYSFLIEGKFGKKHTLVTGYAKYLLEYLEGERIEEYEFN